MSTRTCLHPACFKPMRRGRSCCGLHWHRLPEDLRERLARARGNEARGALQVEAIRHFEEHMIGSHEVTQCRDRGCSRDIVFLETRKGTRMPVDADTVSAEDTLFDPGKHTSHFATCGDPDTFRSEEYKRMSGG